jgi:hypothetical protein
VHRGLYGQWPQHGQGIEGVAQQPVVAAVGRAGIAPSKMPVASVTTERLPPCLRPSTGLGPAVWPPQGALVWGCPALTDRAGGSVRLPG